MPLLADPAWPDPGVELEPACPIVDPEPDVEPAPDGPVWACELETPEITDMTSVVAASSVKIRIDFSP
jgi:hypothetical protein